MTPDVAETSLEVRGFHVKSPQARDRLEEVGRTFLAGFAYAAEAKRPADAELELEQVPAAVRGFAYEGAAMALAIRDVMPGGGVHHVADFIAGEGDRHIYMVYVGVGWAMARLPRFFWPTLYAPDPLLRWLVLDGYGFHQAYFKTDDYVYQCRREPSFGWPRGGDNAYAARVIDQGVGRATWFVAGTDPRRLVRLFDRFAPERQADLYAGAGLAASYAGGATAEELHWLRDAAGIYAADLAQGSAFAAGARVRAGLVMPHNELAAKILCGVSAQEASDLADDTRVGLSDDDPSCPAFEQWRQNIKAALVAGSSRMRGQTS